MLEFLCIIANSWCSFDNSRQINRLQGKDVWGNPLKGGSPLETQARSPGQPPPIRVAAAVPLRNLRPAFGPTWGELGSASARVVRRVMRVALLFVMVLIAVMVFAMVLGLASR